MLTTLRPLIQDIFSYRVEHARGDTHNMIAVIMRQHNLSLQEAVDFVGALCDASIDRFEQDRQHLPSWDPETDRAVATYVQGLQDWMVGALQWSFHTARYFGDEGAAIKRHRVVALSPKQQQGRSSFWASAVVKREGSGSRYSFRHRLSCRDDWMFVHDDDMSVRSKSVA